jgi:secondary thiamine-phosphate synthase enzyme
MAYVRKQLVFATQSHDQIVDITREVRTFVASSGIRDGLCTIFTPHATAAIVINENDDPNIAVDFLAALRKMVKDRDGWLHDRVDGNAAAHIKSALLGPSETIPVADGDLELGTWQNVFFVELDGPRGQRNVILGMVG